MMIKSRKPRSGKKTKEFCITLEEGYEGTGRGIVSVCKHMEVVFILALLLCIFPPLEEYQVTMWTSMWNSDISGTCLKIVTSRNFIYSLIYSFTNYLLRDEYVIGSLLGARDIAVNKNEKKIILPC